MDVGVEMNYVDDKLHLEGIDFCDRFCCFGQRHFLISSTSEKSNL